ncbi:hypothetical protein BST27_14660, partial [Mycobacterium intermedium]
PASPAPAPANNPASPAPANPAPPAVPGDPNAVPPPADPNAPPPVDPNLGRIDNAVGGFSFVLPPGWVESDASHLDYGSALLSKSLGEPPAPGQPAPVANDTRIVLGRLDAKLYASAESTNPKAAVRLGSDMGEFFMPYPGTRVNQETVPLNANGLTGSASYYEVKFTDASKPNGQIWTGVIGSPDTPNGQPPQRWFVVWLGTANNPVDKNAAKVLAESIRPWAPPAAAPAPGEPVPGQVPGQAPAPAPAPAPGQVAPAEPGAPAAPAPAPVPGQAPAGGVAPAPAQVPHSTQPA